MYKKDVCRRDSKEMSFLPLIALGMILLVTDVPKLNDLCGGFSGNCYYV